MKYFVSILKHFKAVGNCFLFFIVLLFFQAYPKSFVASLCIFNFHSETGSRLLVKGNMTLIFG